jgi:hypothetical protein
MGKNKSDQKALDNYKAARKALGAYRCESGDDPTYLKLNKAAGDAAAKVPWYRR